MWNIPSAERLAKIPRLYETEHIPLKDKLIHLHFFIAGCDWYIAEYDGEDLFWGYAILNDDHDYAEWGYISFNELKCAIHFFWTVIPVMTGQQIRQELDSDFHASPVADLIFYTVQFTCFLIVVFSSILLS